MKVARQLKLLEGPKAKSLDGGAESQAVVLPITSRTQTGPREKYDLR